MTHGRVLVVEDNDALRESVAEVLTEEGFEPDQAEHGGKALQLLRERAHPDVILLDLMMPVMSGWEFRQAQLADPAFRDIPVIVMSAMDQGDISADARFEKPFDMRQLLRTVARLAEHGRPEPAEHGRPGPAGP